MPQSYVSCFMHYVFSTKDRQDWINLELRKRLYPYFGGIAKTNRMKMLTAGGTENHVHLLMSQSTVFIPKVAQLIKGGSSKWIHDTFPALKHFRWQKGYGAFSINVSHVQGTLAYIERQEEHHREVSFKEEFLSFLKKHNIAYDERYIWD